MFWRRRIAVLLLVGVLVGVAYWPVAGWLADVRDNIATATRQEKSAGGAAGGAAGEANQDKGRASGSGPDGQAGKRVPARPGPDGARQPGKDPRAGRAGSSSGSSAGSEAGAVADPVAGAAEGARPRKPAVPICAEGEVAVSVRPERESALAGRGLTFELAVRNDGERPCRVPPDPRRVRVAVLGGSTRVLDTDRCPAPIEVRPSRVKPERSATVTVRWNGRRTGTDCSADAPPAGPGDYSVQAEVLGAFSDPVPFELR